MVEAVDYAELKRSLMERWDAETEQVNVVFAPGKTGTTTVATGMKRAGLHPVFQLHTLRPGMLAKKEAEYEQRPNDSYPLHVWEGQWLRRHLPREERPWRLVTSVRDPVARIASSVFQARSRWVGFRDGSTADALLAELAAAFDRDLERIGAIGWDWFDFDLEPVLGMSVYDIPFDPAVGYGMAIAPHVRALLLRAESLDRAPTGLAELFGRPIDLQAANVGEAKDYGSLYAAVLERFRPPRAYVDQVYATRMLRHFYSGAELEAFRRHWTRPISPGLG